MAHIEQIYEVERDRFGVMYSGPLEVGECVKVLPMNDEQIEARRAQIDVHCDGCGAIFPGDTKLNNGLCRQCCRANYHLLRKVERYRAALEKLHGCASSHVTLGPGAFIEAMWVRDVAARALEEETPTR